MKAARLKKCLGMLTALVLTCSVAAYIPQQEETLTASAVSADYAAELVRISTYDNSRNLNISGTADHATCNTWNTNGSQNENWRFDYVGTNSVGRYFKIVNMGTGRLLTPANYNVTAGASAEIYGSESAVSQHWYVTAVSQDAYGNDLYYKITNYSDSNLSLTYNSSANTVTLETYSGMNNQKWLLNAAGLQGWGGYAADVSGKIKASTIGGLLGETVEVTTFDELKAACSDATPRTIVITRDISKTGSYTKDGNGRYQFADARIYLYPNKTIIGSYGANSLYNVYFRTYEGNYGQGRNIILRNIDLSHDKELNNDNIWEFSYGSNFWIDHCTFEGHSAVNTSSDGQDDWDKFLNFKGNTDMITISDCKFGLHEYGVLLGYPADTQEIYNTYNGTPCATLADNYYLNCITRAPGLMRYGYFHSLNNYVYNFHMGYTIYTACKLYAESCYYDGGGSVGSVVNDAPSTSDISATYPGTYTDSGSVAVNCYRNNNLGNLSSAACTWRPSGNYQYTALSAADARAYCTAYSGAQNNRSNMTYAAFSESGYPSAGYVTVPDPSTGTTDPVQPQTEGAVLDTDTAFMLRNAASGYYLDVADGTAANGTNVQQWGASSAQAYNTWKAVSAGDGYYYLYSQLGDGKTYLLDIDYGQTADGTNIGIYENTYSDAQLFKFVSNADGSYKIVTKVSNDASCIDTADTYAGANVREWTLNDSSGQNWYLEYISIDLIAGDVSLDGIINAVDLTLLKRGVFSGFSSDSASRCSDVNADGTVNAEDARLLRDFLLGKPVSLKLGTASAATETSSASAYESAGFRFSGTVYLVGDSTVCEYDSSTVSTYNRYGWGMKLADQFNGVTVRNLALSGRSSRSFLNEANYNTLCSSIGSGDYLFIQFGHNDEKTDENTYPGFGTYPNLDWNTLDGSGKNASGQYSYEWILLNRYVKIARDAGAVPVLITPITRRAANGQPYYQAHTDYQQGLLSMAAANGIVAIDLTALTTELYNQLYTTGGSDATAALHCWADTAHTTLDNTHLSSYGAETVSRIVAEQAKQFGLQIGNAMK